MFQNQITKKHLRSILFPCRSLSTPLFPVAIPVSFFFRLSVWFSASKVTHHVSLLYLLLSFHWTACLGGISNQYVSVSGQRHYFPLSGCIIVYSASFLTNGTWGISRLLLLQTRLQWVNICVMLRAVPNMVSAKWVLVIVHKYLLCSCKYC